MQLIVAVTEISRSMCDETLRTADRRSRSLERVRGTGIFAKQASVARRYVDSIPVLFVRFRGSARAAPGRKERNTRSKAICRPDGSERDRRSRDPEQPELRGEPRQPDLREEMSVDEEDGNRIAIAERELCVGIDVDDVPFVRSIPEECVDFAPHFVAEMAARAREQRQLDHADSLGIWGERATRTT